MSELIFNPKEMHFDLQKFLGPQTEQIHQTSHKKELISLFYEKCPSVIIVIGPQRLMNSILKDVAKTINKKFIEILYHCPDITNNRLYQILDFPKQFSCIHQDVPFKTYEHYKTKNKKLLALTDESPLLSSMQVEALIPTEINEQGLYYGNLQARIHLKHNENIYLSNSPEDDIAYCARVIKEKKSNFKTIYEILYSGVDHE